MERRLECCVVTIVFASMLAISTPILIGHVLLKKLIEVTPADKGGIKKISPEAESIEGKPLEEKTQKVLPGKIERGPQIERPEHEEGKTKKQKPYKKKPPTALDFVHAWYNFVKATQIS